MAEVLWYPCGMFHVERTLVHLWLYGRQCTGWAAFTPSGEARWRVGNLKTYTKLPRRITPDAWRPVDPASWPHQLPPVLVLRSPPTLPPPKQATPAPAADDDGWWVRPDIRLGHAGERPQCVRETEARILRWYRTADVLEHEPVRVETAWPPALMKDARHLEELLRAAPGHKLPGLRPEDYDDYNDDWRNVAPRPARWEPTARDVSDYEVGLVPRWVPHAARAYFRWRAAMPAYSIAQIAARLRIPEDAVRSDYEYQCQQAHKRATA